MLSISNWDLRDYIYIKMKAELNQLEKAVLEMMLKEHSANQIAQKLSLSIRQINEIRKSIYEKTEARNQIGLIKKSIQHNLIDLKDLLNN